MFSKGDFWKRPVPLKPFVFRIREGFLIGLAMDPQKGAPCADCVRLWLEHRQVWVERVPVSSLTLRKDLIPELLAENNPHVLYEVSLDGSAVRMDSWVFPNPHCECDKGTYLPPPSFGKNTNLAFSPLYRVFCTRFGTPDGNIWLTQMTGNCPLTGNPLTVWGADREREGSRKRALEEWLKSTVQIELPTRMARGEMVVAETLQNGAIEMVSNGSPSFGKRTLEAMGAGDDKESAMLQGLIDLAKKRTLDGYANSGKNPMLIVGANNWVRTKVPFFLLQHYDLHLLFYPNATQAWVVGLAAFSRTTLDEKPLFVFAADTDVKVAMDQLFCRLLEKLRPEEGETGKPQWNRADLGTVSSKLNTWWTTWIYRCPKISLKDVLQLEPYSKDLSVWREYFRDGQERVRLLSLNNESVPSGLRTIIKVEAVSTRTGAGIGNVRGIGSLGHSSDALA